MPPWSLDPEAWSWNHRLPILAEEALGDFRLIVLPVPAKRQRLKPCPEPLKSDRRHVTTQVEMVATLISAVFDQHPAQSGFDRVRERRRIFFEDEPGANAEPRNTEEDGEKEHPQQHGGGPEDDLHAEDDPVQPQHAASSQDNRSVTDGNAQGADRQDGEIRERYDHDMSAKSMTVCGVGEQVVSRVRDDRLADRVSGRLALRQAYADFRQRRNSLPAHPAIAHWPDGRPYLPAQLGLHCSISHSHRFGVAAVALTPVGIDIEKIRPPDPRLLDYIAEATEAAGLRHLVGNN